MCEWAVLLFFSPTQSKREEGRCRFSSDYLQPYVSLRSGSYHVTIVSYTKARRSLFCELYAARVTCLNLQTAPESDGSDQNHCLRAFAGFDRITGPNGLVLRCHWLTGYILLSRQHSASYVELCDMPMLWIWDGLFLASPPPDPPPLLLKPNTVCDNWYEIYRNSRWQGEQSIALPLKPDTLTWLLLCIGFSHSCPSSA